MKKIIFALCLLSATTSHASQFTDELNQKKYILSLVHTIWKKTDVQPEIGQAIFMQETRGIMDLTTVIGDKSQPKGKQSYGIMQVKVVTALDVLHRYPTVCIQRFKTTQVDRIPTMDIVRKLTTDMNFNILVSALHFKQLSAKLPHTLAIAAYNGGVRGVTERYNPAAVAYAQMVTYHAVHFKQHHPVEVRLHKAV